MHDPIVILSFRRKHGAVPTINELLMKEMIHRSGILGSKGIYNHRIQGPHRHGSKTMTCS